MRRVPRSSLRRQVRAVLLRQRDLPPVLLRALLGPDPLAPWEGVPQTPSQRRSRSPPRRSLPLVLEDAIFFPLLRQPLTSIGFCVPHCNTKVLHTSCSQRQTTTTTRAIFLLYSQYKAHSIYYPYPCAYNLLMPTGDINILLCAQSYASYELVSYMVSI